MQPGICSGERSAARARQRRPSHPPSCCRCQGLTTAPVLPQPDALPSAEVDHVSAPFCQLLTPDPFLRRRCSHRFSHHSPPRELAALLLWQLQRHTFGATQYDGGELFAGKMMALSVVRRDVVKRPWILDAKPPRHGRRTTCLAPPVNYRLLTPSCFSPTGGRPKRCR